MCACICIQQAPDRGSQSDAVYEVISLQREADRKNEGKELPASPNEEDEAEEGTLLSLTIFFFATSSTSLFLSLSLQILHYFKIMYLFCILNTRNIHSEIKMGTVEKCNLRMSLHSD